MSESVCVYERFYLYATLIIDGNLFSFLFGAAEDNTDSEAIHWVHVARDKQQHSVITHLIQFNLDIIIYFYYSFYNDIWTPVCNYYLSAPIQLNKIKKQKSKKNHHHIILQVSLACFIVLKLKYQIIRVNFI